MITTEMKMSLLSIGLYLSPQTGSIPKFLFSAQSVCFASLASCQLPKASLCVCPLGSRAKGC